MTVRLDTDVIIAGAGPVGTALAAELGRRGVDCVVLEMTDGVFRDPRLHAVTIRTMELVRKWGLTDALRNCGWPAEHTQDISFITSLSGYELGRIPWPAIAHMSPPPESPTFAQRCPQSWFNPILHRYARQFASVRLLWHHRLERFGQDERGVEVEVTDLAGKASRSMRARFLVGCDGTRSLVREHLGVDRESTPTYGLAAEAIIESRALADLARPRQAGRYTPVSARGISGSLLPYDGEDRFRMTLMAESVKVDRARMDEAVTQLAGRAVDFRYLTDILPWVNRESSAERYRVGRVFLAGDAAHTMPPTGGHGMNTGVVDAFDLGWKLAAVIQGWGGDGMLESYDFDRRKGAARTAAMAGEIYQDWLRIKPILAERGGDLERADSAGETCRRELGQLLTRTFAREFNALGSSLGYRYSGSPIIVDDGTPEPADDIVHFVQTARPGHRLPHAWVAPGQSTLDLVGDNYTLIDLGGKDAFVHTLLAAARARGIPVDHRRVDDPRIAELFEAPLVLVRPDQHVAWRARSLTAIDVDVIWETLRGTAGPA